MHVIAMSGTSGQSCWLAEACQNLLLPLHSHNSMCRSAVSARSDLRSFIIVVVVLGQEVNALDGVWEVLLVVLCIDAGPDTAQIPIPCITPNKASGGQTPKP